MTQIFAIFIILLSSIAINAQQSFGSTELPHPGPRSNEQAVFLFNEALAAQKKDQIELAVENYEKILKDYPQFSDKMATYQNLLAIELKQKKYPEVLKLAKDAMLEHPSKNILMNIQLMRAEAELQLGKPLQTKLIAEEILKSKPEANTLTSALLFKAEALSQLGKNKEALASLDAAKGNAKFADAELKIRARNCSSQKTLPKQEALDYIHEKNLCFKESAALAKSYPAKESAQVWCDRFHVFELELKKIKTDEFTREKLKLELVNAKAVAATWECKQ